ncbi:hypothetical protein AB996_0925 [Lactococcus cremoris]|uniref:Uncharacterized protein n=1 Tax=Lactococcus lactis subsp. cremoris TaxID=1359 RepID=A0A161U109_LACLC|nr:hypothetical protein [Lactococcus cremoris]KZK07233.1 hypothetical protein AB996_0925 [Lactococcus cremoris]
MENEKEIQGQEINESPETQEETVVEAKTENQTFQEEPSKAEIGEEIISEPVIAEGEVSEPVIEDAVISKPLQAESETSDSSSIVSPDLSKQSAYADIPVQTLSEEGDEIKTKWNWGAFALTMWFGIANRAYLGLLILLGLVPWIGWIFAIVWMIVFGFHGEKWALENRDNHFRDEEEFRKVMDGWNRAGFIAFIIGIVVVAIVILVSIFLLVAVFNGYNNFDNGYYDFGNY